MIIVIPAYNESKTIGKVIKQIKELNIIDLQILVVDDGSNDKTAQVARSSGATVVSHPINRGLGAALSTGLTGSLRMSGDIIVTLDADGQHDPAEIPKMIEPILKGDAVVVIGSRLREGMPMIRSIANFAGNFFTWLLFGIWVSDSQSGFRAFSASAVKKMHLRTSTMEVSSEIIREIARLNLKTKQVPITVKYTEYSLSKGQGFFTGLETLWKLIMLKFFR